jgi:hypothetical protein
MGFFAWIVLQGNESLMDRVLINELAHVLHFLTVELVDLLRPKLLWCFKLILVL